MITEKEAYEKVKTYLDKSKISYTSIDSEKIRFDKDEEISYGKYEGKKINMYSVCFGEVWGIEERSMFIHLNADTGELLYIMTPHGYWDIEE